MKKSTRIFMTCFVLLTITALVFTGCAKTTSKETTATQKVELELFNNKAENTETLQSLIAEFENQNPNIHIVVNYVPEAETVIMTRLSKNDIPDIMSIGGNATFGELARAGVLKDLTQEAVLNNVQPAYVDMLNRIVGRDNKNIYGLPYATNANGVLYNKDKFKELGLEVPTTWDELVSVCDKIKAANEIPFYLTLGEAWTGLIPFNSLASNVPSDDFTNNRHDGKTTFKAEYGEVADKMLTILGYGHDDNFGMKYPDGNSAFGLGKSVMYLQGNWAIPEIKKANPDINLGMFAFPATNDVNRNRLVSGVDVLLAVSEDTKYPAEALKFLEFMVQKDVANKYITEQFALSAVKDVYQNDPVFDDVKVNFEKGRLTSFPDHYFPPGMQIAQLLQGFLSDMDKEAFLNNLDQEWENVKVRSN